MTFSLWLLFALAAPFLWSINNVVDRVFMTRLVKNEYAITFAAGMLRLVYFLILWPIAGYFIPDAKLTGIALLAGVLAIAGVIFYLKALEREETAPAILFFDAINPLLVLVLSMTFLQEKLTGTSGIGFFLLLIAGMISTIKLGAKLHFRRGILWMLVAILCWAPADILYGYLVPRFPDIVSLSAWTAFGSFLGSFLLLIPRKTRQACRLKNFTWPLSTWILFIWPAFLSYIAYYFYLKAIELGGVSLTTVVSNIQTLFIFLIELLIFALWRKEKMDLSRASLIPKGLAFVLLIAGIWLLH